MLPEIKFALDITQANAEGVMIALWILLGIFAVKYIGTVIIAWPDKRTNLAAPLRGRKAKTYAKVKSRFLFVLIVFVVLAIPVMIIPSIISYIVIWLAADYWGWTVGCLLVLYIFTALSYILQGIQADSRDVCDSNPRHSLFNIQATLFSYIIGVVQYVPAPIAKSKFEKTIIHHQNLVLNGTAEN